MTDQDIVTLFWNRDEAALTHTEEQYGTYCYTIAYHILQNRDDANECVNDTYRRAWDAIPPAKPQNLRTYLGKITRHLAFDRYKHDHTQKRGQGQLPLLLDELEECLPCASEYDPVADALILKDCLNRFLRSLPMDNRRVFIRRYWYGDSIPAIAAAFHKSENDVYVTLSRLRVKLKTMLEKEGVTI